MKFSIFAITNSGLVRAHNEDDFAVCKDLSANNWSFKRGETAELSDTGALMVVADGMGGTNAGEVASNLAQLSVKENFESGKDLPDTPAEREEFLKKLILDAHNRVVEHQHNHLDTAGMGTTLVISWIIENVMHVAWSGDSRCYLFNDEDGLRMVTEDHSMIWEMVKAGKMTAEEARVHPESNVITQSLGTEGDPPKPDSVTIQLGKKDRVLLCSDGLNGMVSDQVIENILQQRKNTAETCNELVDAANEAGGEDNITCILMDIVDGPAPGKERDLDKTLIIKPQKSLLAKLVISAVLAIVLIGGTYFVYESIYKVCCVDPPLQPGTTQQDMNGAGESDNEHVPDGVGVQNGTEETDPGVEQEPPSEAKPEQSEQNQTRPGSDSPIQTDDPPNVADDDSMASPINSQNVLPEDSLEIGTEDPDSLRTPATGQSADSKSVDT